MELIVFNYHSASLDHPSNGTINKLWVFSLIPNKRWNILKSFIKIILSDPQTIVEKHKIELLGERLNLFSTISKWELKKIKCKCTDLLDLKHDFHIDKLE